MGDQKAEMSFLDHLEVLRWTLIRSTLFIFVFGLMAFIFKDFIFDEIILKPKDPDFFTYRFMCSLSKKFGTDGLCIDEIPFVVQSRTMSGQFNAHVWTAIAVGFIMAFPLIIWEIWKFIKPGLYDNEKKYARVFILVSSILFFVGVLFGYYIITPLSINFLGSYRVAEEIKNNIDLASYISLIKSSCLASGFIFELPVIAYFLTKLGLITPEFLKSKKKYAIVLVLILSAVITPPDVISQVIVFIPLYILYEFSILISKIVYKQEQKKEQVNALTKV